jgi:hypothetical protein|tara:strand:+ start:291 stop:437 length:147 start_codon:yes stop_codon:yes gene_type:complete
MESIMKESVMSYVERLPNKPFTEESDYMLSKIIKQELKNSKELNKKAT